MPIDREKLIARLMATFLEEFAEHVRDLGREVLALERTGGREPETIVRLLRTAHSVKGAARSVGLTPIEATCHLLEDLLGKVRDGKRQMTPTAVAALLGAADALADAERQLAAKKPLVSARLNSAIEAIKAELAVEPEATPSDSPSAAPDHLNTSATPAAGPERSVAAPPEAGSASSSGSPAADAVASHPGSLAAASSPGADAASTSRAILPSPGDAASAAHAAPPSPGDAASTAHATPPSPGDAASAAHATPPSPGDAASAAHAAPPSPGDAASAARVAPLGADAASAARAAPLGADAAATARAASSAAGDAASAARAAPLGADAASTARAAPSSPGDAARSGTAAASSNADAPSSSPSKPAPTAPGADAKSTARAAPTADGVTPAANAPSTPPASTHSPAPAADSRPSADAASPRTDATLRIAAEKLDRLLARANELRSDLSRSEAHLAALAAVQDELARVRARRGALDADGARRVEDALAGAARGLVSSWRGLRIAARNIEAEAQRARLLPFAEACEGLERSVRDLAASLGKAARVVVYNNGVELDRAVLEALKDPLSHLVRNAVDHGLELPDARRAAHKPAVGTITIAAAIRGPSVEIDVSDDGGGFKLDAVARQLERRGLKVPDDPRELARSAFLPGLSTAPIITDVSGRGVGLDVVRAKVEEHRGTVDVHSEPGRGTTFKLALPLTLSTMQGFLVGAAGQELAFASGHVERAFRVKRADLLAVEGRLALAAGGAPVPLTSLAGLLGLSAAEAADPERVVGIIVRVPAGRWAFATDTLLSEQELVVKSLGARLKRLPHVSGAVVLGTGRIALVLNAASLVAAAVQRPADGSLAPKAGASTRPKRILVADDSITTRSLERGILENAGYEVIVASDGEIALAMLGEQPVDLLVSDVEMPRMNGYELTRAVRASPRLARLPVILLTGLDSPADKQRGIEAGADAYLVKSSFDQASLLDTITQLL